MGSNFVETKKSSFFIHWSECLLPHKLNGNSSSEENFSEITQIADFLRWRAWGSFYRGWWGILGMKLFIAVGDYLGKFIY